MRAGNRDQDTRWSLAIVAVVGATTVIYGFVVGIGIGILLSIVLFVSAMNRSLVRGVTTGETRGSRRIYPEDQLHLLRAQGAQIRVIEIEGAIFFGTSHQLGRRMETLSAGAQTVILDLRRVTMIDATGRSRSSVWMPTCGHRAAGLLLAGVTPGDRLARALHGHGAFLHDTQARWFADVDRALEHAEHALLAATREWTHGEELALAQLSLLEGMDDAQRAQIQTVLVRRELALGEILFRRGEPGDCLYVLAEGSVSILGDVAKGVAAAQRLASFVPGVIFGETAMLDGAGRTASAAADEPSVVYVLNRTDFDKLRAGDPALANLLLLNIARQLSARLRFATATIQAADR